MIGSPVRSNSCRAASIPAVLGGVDLSQPSSTVAPKLDADALTVIVRTDTSLTGRGIASLVRRGSRPGIQAVLDRLVEHGPVRASPAEPLLAMVTASATLTDRIRDEIGSRARGPPLDDRLARRS